VQVGFAKSHIITANWQEARLTHANFVS